MSEKKLDAEVQEQAAEAKTEQPAKEAAPEKDKKKAAKTVGVEEALKQKLEQAEKQAEQLKDQLMRTAAEYDNFRKRSAREQDASFNNGVSFAVSEILVILDTLEMAANAPTADEEYKKGVVLTLEKAATALNNMKVDEIPALGLPFDPNLHNAVMQQPAAEGQESGSVIQVYQKGYKMGDKVIRHATVVVAE